MKEMIIDKQLYELFYVDDMMIDFFFLFFQYVFNESKNYKLVEELKVVEVKFDNVVVLKVEFEEVDIDR